MSALAASRYNAASFKRYMITADALADWLLEANKSCDDSALDGACGAVSKFFAEDPLDGLPPKHRFYGLISSIIWRETSPAFKEHLTLLRISEARRLLRYGRLE